MEGLDAGDAPIHPLVVHALVHIGAVEDRIIRFCEAGALDQLVNDIIIGVVGQVFAHAEIAPAKQQRNADTGHGAPADEFLPPVAPEPHQQAGQQQTGCGDGSVQPEYRGIAFQTDGKLTGLFVRLPAFRHKADQEDERGGEAAAPADRPPPIDRRVGFLFLKAAQSGQNEDEQQHIIPARVVDAVEQLEQRVQTGDHGEEEQHRQHPPQPIGVAMGLEIRDHAGAAENRDPCGHGGPFVVGVREEIGAGRQLRREEKAVQNIVQPLLAAVD